MSYCSQSPIKKKRSVLATCKMKSRNVTEQQHPSALSVHDVQNPNEIPEAFYTQQNHPRFYTRNLERIRTKKEAWSKPLPNVGKLFFVAAAPKKFDDLTVNPRQLNKLKSLFSTDNTNGKIVLVTGPTGSGKTTCIGVIAKSLKLEVLKWEQMCSLEITEYGEDRYLKEETEIDSLLRFIRTSKTTVKSKTGKMENKGVVYHIDELPLSAYLDVERFRRIIYPYLLLNKSFIVFDLTTRDSSWFFSPKRVFSSYFINDLNITELEFYPVSSTFMRKGLRRIVDKLGFRNRLSAQDFRNVERIAKGDMCRAINTIHYSLMCTRDNFSVPPIFEVASYDELFHMLGVLLYAKRNDFPSNLDLQSTVREELQRPPFTRDINDVLDMSKVMMFLHEHEPNFAGTLKSTRGVFEALSLGDILSLNFEDLFFERDYSLQISARATVFYNYRANRIARGFYHYNRPKWYSLVETTCELKKEISELMFPLLFSGVRQSELDIPFLPLIQLPLTGHQYRLATYLTRPWTISWKTDRTSWDRRIAGDQYYHVAQLRETQDSMVRCYQILQESDDENFLIEDSDEAIGSDDSFNDLVVFD